MTMAINAIRDFTGRGETKSSELTISPQADPALSKVEFTQRQDFSDMIKEFAGDVNALQFEAGRAVGDFVTGEATDGHQVMVATQQAGIAMDLMLEVRNRALEGYQELIRMQV